MTTNRDVSSEPTGRKSNVEEDKQGIHFLYLGEEDMIDAGVLNFKRCVDVMEETMGLLEDGDFLMGGPYHDEHGLMLYFPKKSEIKNFPLDNSRDRRFIAMPAYLGGRFHVAGEKWYGSNGNNRNKGLPRSILMVMLNDVETGKPLAYMSGNLLSSVRTGSMPGLATKLLAKKDAKVLALLGCGVINRACLNAIMAVLPELETVKIMASSPTSKSALQMREYVKEKFPNVTNVKICKDMEEAVRGTDIVSEAISCEEGEWPECRREWMDPGLLYISSSTFNMDYQSIADVKKVIDIYGMYENYAEEDEMGYDENGIRLHTGCMGEDFVYMIEDGYMERDSLISLGEIIRGKKPGRESEDEIILVSL